jgi:NAD(P)H-dependent FMN reductase
MRHRRCRACIVNVLALCGSLRAASMNAALLRATARLAPDGISVEIFSGLAELPLFNPDLEADMPASARRLHAAISACDALLIASPEYAHGVTAVIKNALDWLVSFPPFVDKPVAIFNASPRSVHADASLRETLTTMSARLVPDACLALPLRSTGITEQGILDSEHAASIRRALTLLVSGASLR